MNLSDPANESTNAGAVFDQAAAARRLDGDMAALRELAGMFLGLYPDVLSNINTAVQQRDPSRARYATHKLLGTLSSFFAEPATAATEKLQDAIKTEQWSNADEQLQEVEAEVKRFAAAAIAFVDDGPK
jgi:HPt (histidine-containing phosphotransfer) domain-containing protein